MGRDLDVSIVDNVKPPVRQLVESIQDGDTLASLTKRLGQKKSTVQYRLRAAIRDGYVVETDKTYKLGAPMPSPTCALPTVEQLRAVRVETGEEATKDAPGVWIYDRGYRVDDRAAFQGP